MGSDFKSYTISGILKFPRLTEPKKYNQDTGKYVIDYAGGSYEVNIELTAEQSLPHIERMRELLKNEKEFLIKSKKYPAGTELNEIFAYHDSKDADKNLTGNYDFKLKRNAVNKNGKTAKITIVDAMKKLIPMNELAQISNGSQANINYALYFWDKKTTDTRTKAQWVDIGVSMCLLSVQIVKVVKYGNNLDMFEEIPDGYNSTEEQADNSQVGEDELPF